MGTEGLSIADAMSLANNGDFGGNGTWDIIQINN